MKTYRQHPCSRQHRTYNAVARCVWPRAGTIVGEGEYATVSYCAHGPHDHAVTVQLHETLDDAEFAKDFIDRSGCGGRCSRQHEIIRLAHLDDRRTP